MRLPIRDQYYSNLGRISHRLRDTATYSLKHSI